MALQIGGQFAGYRIVGLLGQGGMGVVYEAEHILLGRKAALKTLRTELVGDQEFRQRFIRESQAIASIDHPNIIPIYEAGELDGSAYIAMRYVQGYDLAELIERRGPLEASEALSILDHVGAALDAAHARGLVHRDIKPANILIEEATGRIYLTDFGIVKVQGRSGMTREGFFLGTIDYASPEQIEGKELGPAADLYAFGCALFESLTGRKPFEGPTDMAVIRAHVLGPPPKVTAFRPDLPSALDEVIGRALAKDAEQRFASSRELIEAAQMAVGAARPPVDMVAAVTLASAPRPPAETRLPVPPTSLIGREQELADVTALLRDPAVHLVTLTGFGGTGKTRLSLEAAAALQGELDVVVFVDLLPVREPELVPAAIAQELGVEEVPGRSLAELIQQLLGSRAALLVLDNFEQVLPAATFVTELLAAAPQLSLLVTSQSPLRVRGEHEYGVPPLTLPDDLDVDDPHALGRSPAVALFVERVQAVRPGFELTAENAAAVAEICRRLDGIPLAIELAAARAKLLTPQAMRSRLQRRLELLTGGAADLPPRQRTLRGAIDWTYSLLDETEQGLLARLGAFVGGCSLEAAEAVAGEPFGLDLGGIVNGLASLVDKSLLRQEDAADGEPRFTMLGTIREYALERLAERGELDQVRRLHADRFLELVETAEPELARANQALWLERLDEENGNIRAALAWSLESGETELGLRLVGALVRFWSIRGHMAEGRGRLQEALADAGRASEPVRAKAEFAAGYAALGLGDFADAEARFEQSRELAERAGDIGGDATARAQLAWIALTRTTDGGGRARDLADESLRLAREVDDKRTASGALNTLAELALQRGEGEEALRLLEEGLALRRGLGDKRLVSNSLLNLGRARLVRSELDHAAPLLGEGLALAKELGDTWSVSVALAALGRLRLLEDDPGQAAELFRDGLRLAAARGDKRAAADCLQGLGGALGLEGDVELAARLFGAAAATLEAIGASPTAVERVLEERLSPRFRAELGDDFDFKLAAGRALTLDEAVALALPSDRRTSTAFEVARA
jgi:non-specific serine/threonine protein kinase